MLHVLGITEDLEELQRVRPPSGNVTSQLLQHKHRSLAAAQGDGLRNLCARIVHRRRDAPDGLVADQVANVRNNPLRAGLDEKVVVELVEFFCEGRQLLVNDHQQRLERPSGLLRRQLR